MQCSYCISHSAAAAAAINKSGFANELYVQQGIAGTTKSCFRSRQQQQQRKKLKKIDGVGAHKQKWLETRIVITFTSRRNCFNSILCRCFRLCRKPNTSDNLVTDWLVWRTVAAHSHSLTSMQMQQNDRNSRINHKTHRIRAHSAAT